MKKQKIHWGIVGIGKYSNTVFRTFPIRYEARKEWYTRLLRSELRVKKVKIIILK